MKRFVPGVEMDQLTHCRGFLSRPGYAVRNGGCHRVLRPRVRLARVVASVRSSAARSAATSEGGEVDVNKAKRAPKPRARRFGSLDLMN